MQIKRTLKSLSPTLRERKRYIAFKIITDGKMPVAAVKEAIMSSFKRLYGEVGLSKGGVQLVDKRWNPETNSGILRVSHNYVDELRAALAFIKDIRGKKVIVKSLITSGMIKKAEKAIT